MVISKNLDTLGGHYHKFLILITISCFVYITLCSFKDNYEWFVEQTTNKALNLTLRTKKVKQREKTCHTTNQCLQISRITIESKHRVNLWSQSNLKLMQLIEE